MMLGSVQEQRVEEPLWKENRRSRRFGLRLKMTLVRSDRDEINTKAETKNVSSAGVYFTAAEAIPPGSPIEFVITLPELSAAMRIRLLCKGTVTRVEVNKLQGPFQVGLAATIERYEFMREDQASS